MSTPSLGATLDSSTNLGLGNVPQIEDPEVYDALLIIHTALESVLAKVDNSVGTSDEVQTTDATPVSFNSLALEDETTYNIEATIVGVSSDGADRASYHLAATVYRTGAGVAIIQGQSVLHSAESDAAWDTIFAVSGPNISVQVTGIAATTIEWASSLSHINISS